MRPNINEIIGVQNFAVLYRWEVIFPQLPNAMANASVYSLDDLNLRALSSEYPKYTQEEIETSLSGHKVYQAGMRTYDPITLTFVEAEDGLIQNFIRDCGTLLWKPGYGTQANKADYVFPNVILRPLRADDTPIVEYTLKNAWIQNHTIGNPDGSSNEVIKPEITFRYDYFLNDGETV